MLGYKNRLYMLPFDHRASFFKLLGLGENPDKKGKEEVKKSKRLIYDAFLRVRENYPKKEFLGILVDEEFGSDVLKDAIKKKIPVAMTVEKSGQEVFDFQYGRDYKKHLKKFTGTMAKTLVRYNPENTQINKKQVKRLKEINNFCHKEGITFLFELLVVPTQKQLNAAGGDKKKFDLDMRPRLMARSIIELQKNGVEPDIWKIEALDTKKDWKIIENAVHNSPKRKDCAIIVLGRGESLEKVENWIKIGASVKGTSGFAVGRTDFADEVKALHEKKITREQAIRSMAKKYREFIDLWDNHAKSLKK